MDLFKLFGTIAIDNDTANEEIDETIKKAKELEDELESTGKAASTSTKRSTSDAAKSVSSTIKSTSVMLGNLASELTMKLGGIGKDWLQTGWNFNVQMESYKAGFKNLLDFTDEEADAFMKKLQQFAIETPLSFEQVMENAYQMLGTGWGTDDLIDVLTMLGNIASGDNERFAKVERAFRQVVSKGRLQAEEAEQFAEQGVDAYQISADYFNTIGRDGKYDWSKADVMELANNPPTMVTGDEFYKALMMASGEGGLYYGRMDAYMTTTAGKMQKFSDASTQAAAAFIKPFTDVAQSETLDRLTAVFDKFLTWAEEHPEALESLATALSDLAVNGLDVLLTSLSKITEWYHENSGLFAAIFSLAGIAMIKSHPVMGAGLIAVGASLLGVQGEETLEEAGIDLSGENAFVQTVGPPVIGLVDSVAGMFGGSLVSLSPEDEERFNSLGSNIKDGVNRAAGETVLTLAEVFDSATLKKATDALGILEGSRMWLPDNESFNKNYDYVTDYLRRKRTVAEGYGLLFPSESIDSTSDIQQLFQTPPDPGSHDYSVDWTRFTPPDGTSGSNSVYSMMATLMQSLSTLKADVAAATQEGVAAGLSGVTITGNITTGDVKLNNGALVGVLTPQINMRLGWQNKLSGRG